MNNLTPKDQALRLSTPPLQGRGKGWGISAARLAELHARARAMRNNPTEPEKRLWRMLSNGQLGGFKFRRQAVIPPYIADFLCPVAKLIVEVDGDTHDAPKDVRRDSLLAGLGYRVVRVTNADVMTNMDGVFAHIRGALASSPGPHPNPSPKGEGLSTVEAQKLLSISLEGSLG
jgi:very-short-patch-repair endonuclease